MNEIVDRQPYLHQMKQLDLMRFLTDDEINEFLTYAEGIAYPKGDKIIHLGDVSPYYYGIVDGSVHVTLRELDDQEVFICSIEQGEMFGEAAIFTSEKRIADVTSAEPSFLLRIHRRQMMSFVQAHALAGSKILMFIVLSLLGKLRDANQELAFEKQSVIDVNDIDALVHDFMTRSA
jgi:CRP-like cAMP-binding protein